jgi:hypothetical protein
MSGDNVASSPSNWIALICAIPGILINSHYGVTGIDALIVD